MWTNVHNSLRLPCKLYSRLILGWFEVFHFLNVPKTSYSVKHLQSSSLLRLLVSWLPLGIKDHVIEPLLQTYSKVLACCLHISSILGSTQLCDKDRPLFLQTSTNFMTFWCPPYGPSTLFKLELLTWDMNWFSGVYGLSPLPNHCLLSLPTDTYPIRTWECAVYTE